GVHDVIIIARGIRNDHYLNYKYANIPISISIVPRRGNNVIIAGINDDINLYKETPVSLNEHIIGEKSFKLKNQDKLDESLRKFIDQIQARIINYLGNSTSSNHSQAQVLRDSNKMQMEHLEGKTQQIDDHLSSYYSMAPSSLTSSSATTSTKDNLGSDGRLLSSRMNLSTIRPLYKAGQSEKFISDSLPSSVNKIVLGHKDEVQLTRSSTQMDYDEIVFPSDTNNEEFSLYRDESLDMNNDPISVTSNIVPASTNMFERINTLQSSNSPCDLSNSQSSKQSLNSSNLGHVPKRMKHTQFQNTNAERPMLGLPLSVSQNYNTSHHAINLNRKIISYSASSSQSSTGVTHPPPSCDFMQQQPYHLPLSYHHPMDNMSSLLDPLPAPPLNRPFAPPLRHEQQQIHILPSMSNNIDIIPNSTPDDILTTIINLSTSISDPAERQAMVNDPLYHKIYDEVQTRPSNKR
ncbi:unnamed protein product, partial [Rotaria sp. Silwood2]